MSAPPAPPPHPPADEIRDAAAQPDQTSPDATPPDGSPPGPSPAPATHVPTPAEPAAGVAVAAPRGRLDALDGIRCFAVLAVMAFHMGATYARGGSIGVDVFFVLSGFLITSLLVSERTRTGRVSLGRFYVRRALRLLPALVLVVLAMLLWSAVATMTAQGRHDLYHGVAGGLLYISNWQATDGLPLFALTNHLWSLSIEGQFYLVWPPVLLLLLRLRIPRLAVLLTVIGGALASAVLRFVLRSTGSSVERVYYGTDTRMDALLIGCALGLAAAWGWLPRGGRGALALQVGALVAVVWLAGEVAFSSWRSSWTYHGGLVLVAVAAAVLVADVVARPQDPLARVLALPPLVALGRISYGLYLWHWPVYMVLNSSRLDLDWLPTQVIRVAVTVALATASYLLVEVRFQRLRYRFGARSAGAALPGGSGAAGPAAPAPAPSGR
jgi:peptidoglycan/LPS O-acetylase OafA/YrhL